MRISAPPPTAAPPGPGAESPPQLQFAVEGASAIPHAASPTLAFALRVAAPDGESIRAVALNVQLQIAAARRTYDAATQGRLVELFAEPERWGSTLRTLFWARAALNVPAFTGETTVELPVACTCDFEVVAARYLHAVRDGIIPIELLFSGSVFYAGEGGALRTGRIPWDAEARYDLPARAWNEAMEAALSGRAWLALGRDAFDRLHAFRAAHALAGWDATVDALLRAAGDRE